MEPSSLDVSVIICTSSQERLSQLAAAVESVKQQRIPPREIIVVVDHNPALSHLARGVLKDATIVENKFKRGSAGARNSGVAQAQSEFVAFLDDDAVAARDWLSTLYQDCQDDGILGAGANVIPIWETGKPGWFPEEFYWVVGCSYVGLTEKRAPIRNPFGGGMCIRREIFQAVGGFREEIGRLGEEAELCIRSTQHWPRRKFLFEPRARIYHHVTPHRASWSYFCSRCYLEGLAQVMVSKLVGRSHRLGAAQTPLLRTLLKGVLRALDDAAAGYLDGLGRSWAIIIGVAVITLGYVVGLMEKRAATSTGFGPTGIMSQSPMSPPA